ncbi:hypothetical protein [Streptomyces sp. ISL-100]|uniref:hypothetical protein n=1 Tax=Streptomyces sp. ISL-100 TaxID=2819173 RepID=UPI001BE7F8DB|nr:hypothetical protein [Streptomyces sp. ISL-100]MBT2397719.1 hypothetical protein [Streptomyces sp. ISL-100]
MSTRPHAPARYAACALLAALAVAGCSDSPSAAQPATTASAPQKSSPEETCTELVSYWAKETLKGSKWSGLDWEQKGLSNEQYAIHEEIVAAGRAEARRQGREAGLKLIDRVAKQKCAAKNGATGSSENWRAPE